jgi:hypothetical protein
VLASDHFADQLRTTAGPVFMYASMAGIFQQMDLAAFQTYRDRLMADSGHPTDPIEVMLLEQLALAHMNIGRLQFNSATARSLEAARAYGAMATQLLGEFRRTTVALRAYRDQVASRTDATVEGRAAPAAHPARAGAEESEVGGDSELGTEQGGDRHGEDPIRLPEPEAGRGREAEPRPAPRAQRRRA